MSEETSSYLSQLLDATSERERSRALGVAAAVRLAGCLLFLALAIALGTLGGLRNWGAFVPLLTVYTALALVFFLLRRRSISPRLSWLAALVDVGAAYLIQREGVALAESPLAAANLGLGPFALLVALSALTLQTTAVVVAAGAATLGQVLLLNQAGGSAASMVSAGIILFLMAIIGLVAMRRVRLLAVDLSEAEIKHQLEEQVLARVTAKNDRLARLQRDKDSLVQLIVHDLRSPLNAIMLSLDYLAEELRGGKTRPEVTETLEDAQSTSKLLAGMVAQILDTAKLEEGHITLEMGGIGAQALFEDVRQEMAPIAKNRGVQVRIEAPPDLTVRGDPRLFRRVIENLVSNSIRHTRAGGQILIAACREDKACRVSVHNEGQPIAPADRDRIFAKFQQGGSDGSRLAGWGLGLYFCRMVVEAHQGTIGVEDVEGWPASFVVRMPASAKSEHNHSTARAS